MDITIAYGIFSVSYGVLVVMHMGIVRRDNCDDYWRKGCFRDLFVTSVFPKQERFDQIFFALHVRLEI
jgi:hypothetical protein